MELFQNAQHCLTIAAAFIAIVAACASLISLANDKADSIASRYREVTTEYSELKIKDDRTKYEKYRLNQLWDQINLYKDRVPLVVDAQRFLFHTIRVFIGSIAGFIFIALLIVIFNRPDAETNLIIKLLLGVIAILVILGAVFMYFAVRRLLVEIEKAKETFKREIEDCLLRPEEEMPAEMFQPVWVMIEQ